jgi:hypothetical protein
MFSAPSVLFSAQQRWQTRALPACDESHKIALHPRSAFVRNHSLILANMA